MNHFVGGEFAESFHADEQQAECGIFPRALDARDRDFIIVGFQDYQMLSQAGSDCEFGGFLHLYC